MDWDLKISLRRYMFSHVGVKMSAIILTGEIDFLGFSTILIFSNFLLYIIMEQTKSKIKICVSCTL